MAQTLDYRTWIDAATVVLSVGGNPRDELRTAGIETANGIPTDADGVR